MSPQEFRLDRENRGLSQKGMADAIGVSEDVVRSIELGRIPQPANRLKVAAFFEMTVTEMWPLESREDAA